MHIDILVLWFLQAWNISVVWVNKTKLNFININQPQKIYVFVVYYYYKVLVFVLTSLILLTVLVKTLLLLNFTISLKQTSKVYDNNNNKIELHDRICNENNV